MLGTSDAALKLRHKYAFLNIRSAVDLDAKRVSPFAYGKLGAVLKEEVRDRATWTAGDSLNAYLRDLRNDTLTKDKFPLFGTFGRGSLPTLSGEKSYYEAQILGDLGFADIKYFVVEKFEDAELLRGTGKPVYLAIVVTRNRRVVIETGKLLIPGI